MSRGRFGAVKTILLASLFIMLASCWNGNALALDPRKAITQYVQNVWQDELPQNSIHTIVQTHDGYIWLGTYEGLVRFDGIKFIVYGKRNSNEIKSNDVSALFEDREGNLWIGTENGLTCLKDGKFTSYTIKDGLSHTFVRMIYEDRQDALWICTDGGL